MRKAPFAAAVGLALSHPALAGDLSGRWNISAASVPNYEGVVLIDEQRRVTWESPLDNGRPAKFMGYIRYTDASMTEMVLTDQKAVIHITCQIAASDLLHCHIIRSDRTTPLVVLTRVGPGPQKLTR